MWRQNNDAVCQQPKRAPVWRPDRTLQHETRPRDASLQPGSDAPSEALLPRRNRDCVWLRHLFNTTFLFIPWSDNIVYMEVLVRRERKGDIGDYYGRNSPVLLFVFTSALRTRYTNRSLCYYYYFLLLLLHFKFMNTFNNLTFPSVTLDCKMTQIKVTLTNTSYFQYQPFFRLFCIN